MESTKLVSEFGVNQIDQKLIDRIEKLTNKPASILPETEYR